MPLADLLEYSKEIQSESEKILLGNVEETKQICEENHFHYIEDIEKIFNKMLT